ncbi:hypothetical protein CsSME_00015491 [Camellia sinensis var. sinensis]
MAKTFICFNNWMTLPAAAAYAYALPIRVHPNVHKSDINQQQHQHRGRPSSTTSTTFTTCATKSGGFFVNSVCSFCLVALHKYINLTCIDWHIIRTSMIYHS